MSEVKPEPHEFEYGLMPCPFCGCGHELDWIQGESNCIRCHACDACGPPRSTLEEARAAWNDRNKRHSKEK